MLVPTLISFLVLVATMITSAFFLFSSSVTDITNEQTLLTSQQVLTNYESYFDSVITVSNNVLGTYSNIKSSDIESGMFLGRYPMKYGMIDEGKMKLECNKLFRSLDMNVNPSTIMRTMDSF